MSKTVACIGECMLELRSVSPGLFALDYAGDTYNTAYYLARSDADIQVEYATVLGTDRYSDAMLETFAGDSVGSNLVARVSDRQPGLYFIHLDESGERSFTYYRENSAARTLFSASYDAEYRDAIARCDVIYFSGITLSIITDDARDRLFGTLHKAREAGAIVVFDSNYRPQSWPDAESTRKLYARAYQHVNIALPSFDDEQALFGDATPADCAARIASYGVPEIVVKRGTETGAWRAPDGKTGTFRPTPAPVVVDTTGAGDSFNAGYLAARLNGETVSAACQSGAELSGHVVRHRGAIERDNRVVA